MHTQLPNMSKDNVLFKTASMSERPELVLFLFYCFLFGVDVVSSPVKLLDPAPSVH